MERSLALTLSLTVQSMEVFLDGVDEFAGNGF